MNHLTFLMGMLVFILALSGSASVGAAANEPTALLVMTRRGGDAEQFKARLSQQGFTMLREARCLRYGYSILEVQPNAGTARAALATLKSFKDADLVAAELKFDSVFSGCTPDINDPDYDAQWHLQTMNLEEMHCLLDAQGVTQSVQPRITLIDSGITAIKKELNRNQIREFDFVGGVNGVEESVLIDGASNQHGTAVTSVAAATTNNGKFLASPASRNKQVKITMCRISDDGTIDTFDVIDAMVWCVDNQDLRGGPGVINLSINTPILPTYNGSEVIQNIAKDAFLQGDLFVNGAGNANFEDPSPNTKHFRVIVGLDETGMRWVEGEGLGSVYGNYKASAPCTDIPYVVNDGKATVLANTGTSLAAPSWASCVALLMSIDPTLTAPKADKILFKTGTRTPDGHRSPDLRKAVKKVLEQ